MTQIVLVTYELNQGGTNRVSCHLANGFAEAGHETTLVACTSAGALDVHLKDMLRPEVASFGLSQKSWKSRSFGQIATFRAFRRWLKQKRPEILLATGNNISWFTGFGALTLPELRMRYFIKTTNPIIRERDGRFVTFVRRRVYNLMFRRAEAVLTLSDSETRLLQKQFPKAAAKFRTVYNAYVTDEALARTRIAAGEPGRQLVVLGVGRLVDQKNFPRLLRAFALANPSNAVLRIAGDGPDRAALMEVAESLGIASRVEFLGFVSDVPALMASADVFVLSSDYEGLPAVVVEALASNCPVISTDCFANARDLLTGLPGCMVTEKSDEALADALRTWLAAPVLEPDLRPYAMNYSTGSSVRSHLEAMGTAAG